jgi:GTP-binding protein LepA
MLEAVIARIPPPKGDPAAPLKALIIDSWFDNYVGVVMLVRVVDGRLAPKDRILLMASRTASVRAGRRIHAEIGADETLSAGEVGFVIAGIKELQSARVGDTITLRTSRRARRCPASRRSSRRSSPGSIRSMPTSTIAARCAREAAAERFVAALRAGDIAGAGLWLPLRLPRLLHLDIVQERLEREYDMH